MLTASGIGTVKGSAAQEEKYDASHAVWKKRIMPPCFLRFKGSCPKDQKQAMP